MNPGLMDDHASIEYYDADYPSPDGPFPENFDATTEYQGVARDIARYSEIAGQTDGPVLEPFCGTGRVLLPLVQLGRHVTGIDISEAMLNQCRTKLAADEALRSRVTLVRADVREWRHPNDGFALAVVAFNSLLCIPEFDGQLTALRAICAALVPGGLLALDIVNPLNLKIQGDPVPRPFFTRRNTYNGNTYTRFASFSPFDAEHRQKLEGWYDEIASDGTVRRRMYSMIWRPIFRYEIQMMLEKAGFELVSMEGGHRKEPYVASSPRMFITARSRA
jgi:SAM-dependent methyltransferase